MPIDYSLLALKKPEPRSKKKRRERREEGAVKQDVRADCVQRDGYCRLERAFVECPCAGPSEWCHLGEMQRFKTRRKAPEERHTTAGTMMGCRKHHQMIDGKRHPRIYPEFRSPRGADGPMAFRYLDQLYVEPEASQHEEGKKASDSARRDRAD